MVSSTPMMLNSRSTTLQQNLPSALQISGGFSLQGEVKISGAKNSALVVMAASLLCTDECQIHNVPNLTDVAFMSDILEALGAKVKHHNNTLDIDASHLTQATAPYEIVRQLRASFFVIGPLLARLGAAQVALPGGCTIGSRPVDLHLQGLQAMGANIEIRQDVVYASVERGQRLQGAHIHLDCPSVGATETLMMAATLAEGETVIENAAREPEVVDLANFCQAMGARVYGAGTPTIVIYGVSQLHAAEHHIIPDRIEAGTFLTASMMTHSPLMLTDVNSKHIRSIVEELWVMGAKVFAETDDRLRIIPPYLPEPRIIKTRPYPGFPTDMQPQFMALLSLVEGNSLIIETLFENRFQHAAELSRMRAKIRVQGNRALIQGVSKLVGASVTATDLRASAALVLAALVAEGTTTIHNLHYLDRGYEKLEQKLLQLGAKLERVEDRSQSGQRTNLAATVAPQNSCLCGVDVA